MLTVTMASSTPSTPYSNYTSIFLHVAACWKESLMGMGGVGKVRMETNAGMPSDSVPRPGNSKHQWTDLEDEKLVDGLYDLFTMGIWKCDTGFKSGYLVQLEKMLAEKLPNSRLKATPHIESRVKTLKKQCLAIAEMFTHGSGFSWVDEEKMVTSEKNVFDDWVKSHPNARGLRHKKFSHYDTLLEIFGKDRANGRGATTHAAEEEEIESVMANESSQPVHTDGTENIEVSINQFERSPTSQLPKRSRNDGYAGGMKEHNVLMKTLVDGTMEYLAKVGNAIASDNDRTDRVVDELQKIDGLTLEETMEVGKIIIDDHLKSRMFLVLTPEKRKEMVFKMLQK